MIHSWDPSQHERLICSFSLGTSSDPLSGWISVYTAHRRHSLTFVDVTCVSQFTQAFTLQKCVTVSKQILFLLRRIFQVWFSVPGSGLPPGKKSPSNHSWVTPGCSLSDSCLSLSRGIFRLFIHAEHLRRERQCTVWWENEVNKTNKVLSPGYSLFTPSHSQIYPPLLCPVPEMLTATHRTTTTFATLLDGF